MLSGRNRAVARRPSGAFRPASGPAGVRKRKRIRGRSGLVFSHAHRTRRVARRDRPHDPTDRDASARLRSALSSCQRLSLTMDPTDGTARSPDLLVSCCLRRANIAD